MAATGYEIHMEREARQKLTEEYPRLRGEVGELRSEIAGLRAQIDGLITSVGGAVKSIEEECAQTRRVVDKIAGHIRSKGAKE